MAHTDGGNSHVLVPTIAAVKQVLEFNEVLWQLGALQAEQSGSEAKTVAFQKMLYPCENGLVSAVRLLQVCARSRADRGFLNFFECLDSCGKTNVRSLFSRFYHEMGVLFPISFQFAAHESAGVA